MPKSHLHFVTGKMATDALTRAVTALARQHGFSYSIQTMPISVAALMTLPWIAQRLQPDPQTTEIILPGYCGGDLNSLADQFRLPVKRGPKDLLQLPGYFGGQLERPEGYGPFDIEILAEINHAPQWSPTELRKAARQFADDGADIIDVGCDPTDDPWPGIGACVQSLRDEGLRVAVDSFHPQEVADAVRYGAELVLSVNSSNRRLAVDWNCEVVAIPDDPSLPESLDATIEFLDQHQIPFRIDPILEPIGCGFAASLRRYAEVRERYPNHEMMMGIGNVSELTDADSAGINVLLLGLCQELAIRSVLTTQVISWAQSSVRECSLARRLVWYACRHRVPAKHLEPDLVLLRDANWVPRSAEEIAVLTQSVRDQNVRIMVADGEIFVISGDCRLRGRDPYMLFDELVASRSAPLDASHAFYIGYELAKAATAITLGKGYVQDEALRWGFLTAEEASHQARRKSKHAP